MFVYVAAAWGGVLFMARYPNAVLKTLHLNAYPSVEHSLSFTGKNDKF